MLEQPMNIDARNAVAAAAGFPRFSLVLLLAALALLVGVLVAGPRATFLQRWEHSTADMRTALFSDRRAELHPHVALVTITDASLPTTPIDRGFLADLVTAVDRAGAAAIGLDVFFRRPTVEAKDAALKTSLREARAKVIMAAWDERGMDDPGQQAFQADFVAATGRPAGYLNLQIERDRIVRFIAEPAAGSRYPQSFSLLLARTREAAIEPRFGRIAWLQRVASQNPLSWLVNVDGTSPFAQVTAAELLGPDGARHAARLKDKIVLIGVDLKVSSDNHRTPLAAWSGRETPGVAIHAQVVAQLIDGRRVTEVAQGHAATALIVALGMLGLAVGWWFHDRKRDFLSWGTAGAVLVAIDAVMFKALNIILPFLLCLLAWFSGVTAGYHGGRVMDWLSARRKR
jgi:CHASE2 domain-containing sensor protein